MGVLDEILAANAEYAADFGARSELGLTPARHFAILTCMDARLDPAKYAGLSEGDAHVIRNAGGRATDDAIRSLVISHKLLGTNEWFVIHHTECGMESFNEEKMRSLLEESLGTEELEPDAYLDWLTIWRNGSTASSTMSPGFARTPSSRRRSRSTATSST